MLLIDRMIDYFAGDPKRIQHFLKVHAFAKLIGELEGLGREEQAILELAAIVHDVGIKASEEKYDSKAGHYQELEGPPIARQMLEELNYGPDIIDRVCFLVAHHHTYTNIDKADYQILVEADFLVNIHEGNLPHTPAEKIYANIFRSKSGRRIFERMYGVAPNT